MDVISNTGVSMTSGALKNNLRLSYILMAGIGILSLVFGGSVTIWLRDLSHDFIEIHEPRVELYERLAFGLESSTSSLTDYVNKLSEQDRLKYRNIWKNTIYPTVDQLLRLEKENPGQLKAIKGLERELKELALWQWHVEDIVAIPGNNPARLFLDTQLLPVIDDSLLSLDILLDMEKEGVSGSASRITQLHEMKYSLMLMKYNISIAIQGVGSDRFYSFINEVIKINFLRQNLRYANVLTSAGISGQQQQQQQQQQHLFSLIDSIFSFADDVQVISNKNKYNVAIDWLYSENRKRVDLLETKIELLLKDELTLLHKSGDKIQLAGSLIPYILMSLFLVLSMSGWYFIRKGVTNFIKPVIQLENQDKLKEDVAELNKALLGVTDLKTLSNYSAQYFAKKLNASAVAIFIKKSNLLRLSGGYALPKKLHLSHEGIEIGQGLVGQVFSENKSLLVKPKKGEGLNIESSLVEVTPKELFVVPIRFQKDVIAVLELASLREFTHDEKTFIEAALFELGNLLNSALQGERVREALADAQSQSEELQANQEELHASNDELESQKEELHATNEELLTKGIAIEQKSSQLEKANDELSQKSKHLEKQAVILKQSESDAAEKACQLEESSRYKSEFLANMSHELRTPLNSLLILAKMLADNEEDNLDAEQCESASVIHDSGTHLLNLINDILDLSKIEAGRVDVAEETVMIADLASSMSTRFSHMAENKGIQFVVSGVENSVNSIISDSVKLQQILTNLIGNSIKFTPSGTVTLDFSVVEGAGIIPGHEKLLALSVTDTGIGIEKDKQAAIFEAFQQEDGSTSRNFGGTGLGLSISLAYSKLLDGDIKLESQKDVGSTFTLYLPLGITKDNVSDNPATIGDAGNDNTANDNAANDNTIVSNVTINEADKDKLITPDHYSKITPLRPEYANGCKGQLMLVEDDDLLRTILTQKFTNENIKVLDAPTATGATELLKSNTFDCVVLDIGLPDSNGFEWLEEIERHSELVLPPVIIYSGRDLTKEDELRLSAHTDCIIIKSVRSSERLLDEVLLCLQNANKDAINNDSVVLSIPDKTITEYHTKDINAEELTAEKLSADNVIKLKDKRVLVVDDDMRNTFALSKVLRSKGMVVEMASGGEQALEKLSAVGDFDMVLMDIMMPGMDGYQTTTEIRKLPQYRELPIIAVTAKAMKGDKEKCMAAGANDYLSKPIDMDKLQSSMLAFV